MSSLSTRYQWSNTSGATAITDNAVHPILAAPSFPGTTTGSQIALTDIDIVNTSATVSTLVAILAGVTIVAIFSLPASTAALVQVAVARSYDTPLQIGKNVALNIQCVTSGANVYWNAAGFYFNS
jgi:hypothetical protein